MNFFKSFFCKNLRCISVTFVFLIAGAKILLISYSANFFASFFTLFLACFGYVVDFLLITL